MIKGVSRLKSIYWGKTSSKVLFVVFAGLMFLSSYFIYSSYKIYLSNAEEATLKRLKGISNTMSLNVNYKSQEHLNNRLESGNYADIESDSCYIQLHEYLKKCQLINNLKTEISVLYLNRIQDKFFYIATSNDTCFFGDEYVQTIDAFSEKYDQGAMIGEYIDEYGTWLTAFSPILDESNLAVGIIEVDILFDDFINKAKGQLYRNLLISVSICLITGFFLLNYVKKIVIEEETSKIKLEKSHHIITEKNKDIIQSINYAKRIQSAILPSTNALEHLLSDHFILYKPKDIVAGDFYWLEEKDGRILFAAADCTGHGVPGAMVSVVCNNALNRSVREYNLIEPGKILDKVREIVIQEFEKSNEDVKDGMDIALCALYENILEYSGAYNPLWIVRKDELIEIKADKQPIGKFDNPLPYVTHRIELQKGDTIYLFTDGYVDQFGGEYGKKFKANAFRKLIVSIKDKTMAEQKMQFEEVIEAWRGVHDQVDDICVIGVRI
jgi:serine phosphatase RsbU (regulator of sigma subunit)